jgi:hypothetical protein
MRVAIVEEDGVMFWLVGNSDRRKERWVIWRKIEGREALAESEFQKWRLLVKSKLIRKNVTRRERECNSTQPLFQTIAANSGS